jgi:hypothetical protein
MARRTEEDGCSNIGADGARIAVRHAADAVPDSFRQRAKLFQQSRIGFPLRDLANHFQFGRSIFQALHQRVFGFASHGDVLCHSPRVFEKKIGFVLISEQGSMVAAASTVVLALTADSAADTHVEATEVASMAVAASRNWGEELLAADSSGWVWWELLDGFRHCAKLRDLKGIHVGSAVLRGSQ